MIRDIHEWIDEKMEEVHEEESDKKRFVKAFGLGAIEGAIDGLAIGGAYLLVLTGICLTCNKFKK